MQGVFPAILYVVLFSQNGWYYAQFSSSSSPGTKTATAKQIEQRTGIPTSRYMEYEMGYNAPVFYPCGIAVCLIKCDG
jgi:hypothetical protein